MKNSLLLALTLTGASLSACVNPQQIEIMEREQRRLRSDIATTQSELDSIRSSLADTRANLQPMQRDLSALKERIEEARVQMGKQLGQSSREGDQRVRNLEARLAKLEEDAKTQAEMIRARDEELKKLREGAQDAQKSALNVPAGDGASEAYRAESEAVRREYEAAWSALDKKDYKVALTRFRDFLKRNPKSNLAPNAQYWIGESHYAQREFDQAIIEFDVVRRKYPQSEKVPAALLKEGYAFAEMGEKLNARLILQELIEKYPQAPEAERAKQRLKTLAS